MFTLRKMFAVMATMAIALLMTPGNASAQTRSVAPAEAVATAVPASCAGYPDGIPLSITLSPAHPRLLGGQKVTITATVVSNSDQQPTGTLVIKVLGKTYTFHSNSATITVQTPVVTKKTTASVSASFTPDGSTATCFIDPPDAAGTVTMLVSGDGSDANLPNTGGTNLWYIVLGATLLGVGVAIIGTVNSRRAKRII